MVVMLHNSVSVLNATELHTQEVVRWSVLYKECFTTKTRSGRVA